MQIKTKIYCFCGKKFLLKIILNHLQKAEVNQKHQQLMVHVSLNCSHYFTSNNVKYATLIKIELLLKDFKQYNNNNDKKDPILNDVVFHNILFYY